MTWIHLTINFQAVVTSEQLLDLTRLLQKQDTKRLGFYKDGTITSLATVAITMELEKQSETNLGVYITTGLHHRDYERLSWEGVDFNECGVATLTPVLLWLH